jgi:cellulase/cellobiase CelA1
MKPLAGILVVVLGAVAVAVAEPEPTPQEQVAKVITSATNLQACYADRVKLKTKLAGKLGVVITIEEKGNVSAVSVTAPLDDQVDACVVKGLRGLTFPTPGQQVKIRYAFDFHT